MALIANNVVTLDKPARVQHTLPAGKTYDEIRQSRLKKLEAKKKRTVSSYHHDMTTIQKL